MAWKTITMLISGLLFCLGSAGYIAAKADLRTHAQNLVDQSDEKIEDSGSVLYEMSTLDSYLLYCSHYQYAAAFCVRRSIAVYTIL